MFRNMACSLIRSVRIDDDDQQKPRVAGRIITTLPKAKELRPFVEKLVTLARKAGEHVDRAQQFSVSADRNTSEWKQWRESEQWNQWNQAIAPAVTIRRRAFAILRDNVAVDILFDELATRFEDRPGGYTRVIRLAKVRLGDAGKQALIEFVGEHDRQKQKRGPLAVDETESPKTADETQSPQAADDSGEPADAEPEESAASEKKEE